jgi:L-glyceraldehyde reductase
VKYCEETNIHLTAYSPLGNNRKYIPTLIRSQPTLFLVVGKPKLTENPVVVEIAKRLNATPAQVLVAWGTRRGQSVIPKSVQEDRIISNFKEVEITDDDFARIFKLGEGDLRHRYNIPLHYNPSWSISIFKEDKEKDARNQVKIN